MSTRRFVLVGCVVVVAMLAGGFVAGRAIARGMGGPDAEPVTDQGSVTGEPTTTRPGAPTTPATTPTPTGAPSTTRVATMPTVATVPPTSPPEPVRCGGRYVSGCHPVSDPVWDIEDALWAEELAEASTTPTTTYEQWHREQFGCEWWEGHIC